MGNVGWEMSTILCSLCLYVFIFVSMYVFVSMYLWSFYPFSHSVQFVLG